MGLIDVPSQQRDVLHTELISWLCLGLVHVDHLYEILYYINPQYTRNRRAFYYQPLNNWITFYLQTKFQVLLL